MEGKMRMGGITLVSEQNMIGCGFIRPSLRILSSAEILFVAIVEC